MHQNKTEHVGELYEYQLFVYTFEKVMGQMLASNKAGTLSSDCLNLFVAL